MSFSKKYAICNLEKYSLNIVGGEKKRKFVKMDLLFQGSQFIVMLMTWLVFMEIDLGYDWRGKKERCIIAFQKSPFLYLNGIHLVDTPGKHWAYFLLPLFQFFHQLLGELHYMAPLAQVYKLKLLATHAFTKFLKEWVVHWKTPIIDYGTAIGCC